ncbi:MAG: ATP-binding protein [Clostridia bacterium]|nr:ATP-binding protein [Clostridia bacterium]
MLLVRKESKIKPHKKKTKENKIKPYKKQKKVKEENLFDNEPELISLLAPEVIQEKRDYIYMGDDKFARIFTLMFYPNYINIGWLDDILNTIGDVDISTQVQVADERNVIKYLTHKITKARSDYMLFEKQGNIEELHRLKENIESFEQMRRDIQINNDKLFFIKITLRLNAISMEELNEKSKMLRDEFANRSCEIRTLYFKQLDALKETLPLNNNIIKDNNRNMTTAGLAAMFPIARTKSSVKEGIYLGRDLFTGLPMNLETFTTGLANANIAIFGVPGAGKSVTVKTIVGRMALLNRRSSILDIEGEYVAQTEKLGGRIIKVRQTVPVGINLFDIDVDEDEGFIDIDTKITEIRAIFNGIINKYENRTLKSNEIADIEQAVREVYKEKEITKDKNSIYERQGGKYDGMITFSNIKKKMPTLTDFHRVMKNKIKNEELSKTISNFLRGSTLGIFDCQSTLKINDQIICFDISEIKDEIMRYYVSLVLTTWITNKYMATKERNKRYVVVDEAWNLFKNKETSDFLENLARRARKKKTAMILATQNLSELRQNRQAEAIINCCDTIILLKQSVGSIDEIMKFFKLPSGTKEILTKARPGECILIRGGDVRAIKIDMTKFESEFITT